MKFLYITDTHIGCSHDGYHLQPRYVGCEEQLFAGLARWVAEHDIRFVVHGGDLTDHGTPEEIDRAVALCGGLGVPVYLCLGNHDLARADSIERWRSDAKTLLPEGETSFIVDAGPVALHVIAHHWHPDIGYRWQADRPQEPRLDGNRVDALEASLKRTNRPAIAVTHAPINAVPRRQCGRDEAFHPPYRPYAETWRRIIRANRNLRLVLTGHNHAFSESGDTFSCTTPAFNEIPAQARVVTVRERTIEIETVSLAADLALPATPDPETAWCIGPPGTFEIRYAED